MALESGIYEVKITSGAKLSWISALLVSRPAGLPGGQGGLPGGLPGVGETEHFSNDLFVENLNSDIYFSF